MDSSLSILVVEDDPADFWLLDRLMKQQGLSATCCRVDRLDDLERELAAKAWDVVLTDYTVPHLAFEDVLALLQARVPDVPIIVVSGTIGEEKAVALMKEGVADFAVVAVDTGEAALERLADARQTVDLLLTDVLLPGITGGELTSHLAGMATPPKVLYTSGYSRDIVATRAELVAGAQFLPKPYTMASLVRTVRKVLDAPAVH
jgi:DNA-binding NtrC family response regulator